MKIKIGHGYRAPDGEKMQFKCYWYLQIGNHIMISAHNHLDRPFWHRFYTVPHGIWFGACGLIFRFQRYPIEWAF